MLTHINITMGRTKVAAKTTDCAFSKHVKNSQKKPKLDISKSAIKKNKGQGEGKKRRFRPGTVALREIKYYQK